MTFLGAVKYDFGKRGFFIYYQLPEYIPWVIMGLRSSLPHKGVIHREQQNILRMRVLENVKDSQICNTDLWNACASIIDKLKYTFDSASDIYLLIYKMFYLYVVLKKAASGP